MRNDLPLKPKAWETRAHTYKWPTQTSVPGDVRTCEWLSYSHGQINKLIRWWHRAAVSHTKIVMSIDLFLLSTNLSLTREIPSISFYTLSGELAPRFTSHLKKIAGLLEFLFFWTQHFFIRLICLDEMLPIIFLDLSQYIWWYISEVSLSWLLNYLQNVRKILENISYNCTKYSEIGFFYMTVHSGIIL